MIKPIKYSKAHILKGGVVGASYSSDMNNNAEGARMPPNSLRSGSAEADIRVSFLPLHI